MAKKRSQRTRRNVGMIVRRTLMGIAEKKVGLTGGAAVTVSNVGTVINLSTGISQGDDITNRSGDKITILHHLLKIRAVAITNSQSIRFILFGDRFNQGTTPAVTDVLRTAAVNASYNVNTTVQQKRFVIYRDVTLDVNLNGETVRSSTLTYGTTGKVFYNGGANAVASNGPGAIFLLVIGSASTGTYDYDWESTFNDS